MKQFFQIIAMAAVSAVVFMCTACTKEDILSNDAARTEIPFMVLSSDGSTILLEKKVGYTEELHGDYSYISASTNMKMAESNFSLIIQTNNLRKADQLSKVNIKEFSFSKPLSGSSYDYTNKYTGKMYLLKYDMASRLMKIRMENVECMLSGVKYTFHGDLECEIIDSPIN